MDKTTKQTETSKPDNPFNGDGEYEGFLLLSNVYERYEKDRTSILRTPPKKRINRGFNWRRTKYQNVIFPEEPNLEKIFSEEWECACDPKQGLNSGRGTLDALLVHHKSHDHYSNPQMIYPTKRERMLVATAIQWLGTNCGFCFLRECLEKAGWSVVRKREEAK